MAVGLRSYTLIAPRTISSTDGYTSATQTNLVHKGAYVTVNRASETGTATLDGYLEFKNATTGTWSQLEGSIFVQWADSATGERSLLIYPGITGAEADAMVPLDTNKLILCNVYLPHYWRLALVTTGTTNVVSANVTLLP